LSQYKRLLTWRAFLKSHIEGFTQHVKEDPEAELPEDAPWRVPRAFTDPSQPLCIMAGTDQFNKMGAPPGADQRKGVPIEKIWEE
jgi:hypothetical protein